MSIIHEALKKAARLRKENREKGAAREKGAGVEGGASHPEAITPANKETSPAELTREATPPETTKKHLRKNKNPLILPIAVVSAVILVSTAVFLLNNFFLPKRPKIETTEQITDEEIMSSQSPVALPPTSPGTLPPPSPTKKGLLQKVGFSGTFVLSGIAYEDKEPMAIINDTIYTVGEYVNGAEIIEINEKRVLLKKGDKEIELKVR